MALITRLEHDSRRTDLIRYAQYAAVGGLAFQLFHLLEHFAQTTYWALHPAEAPWLTPWAAAGRDLLVVGDKVVTGNELLHLIGNGIFFGALLAMAWVCMTGGLDRARYPHLSKALVSQGIHLAEHVLLTATVFTVGKPLGVSTLFGLAAGPAGSTYRIWFHFILNGIATYYAFRALHEMHKDGLVVPGATPAA
ncbi:MAG: hypothetical protein OEX04_01080 [Acidimicrobiia bacterium]|nr:hypothetical protein [Acidimicrobiia bacterium]MDH4306046.1 hypothetical protein [Acidimicrobiia bacterium]MDH5293904.1 hypothetical protein [Acidimicrobiia bacterium]